MQTIQEVSCDLCGKVLSTAPKWATKSDAHLHVILPKEDELVRGVKTSISLGHSDHEIVVSRIPS